MKIQTTYPGQSVQIVDAPSSIVHHFSTKNWDLPFVERVGSNEAKILLFKPLSVYGKTPDYDGALPDATYELCGDKGVFVAVGNRASSIVYRGVWDQKSQRGSWNWVYLKQGDSNLQDPPFMLDYMCRVARHNIQSHINRTDKEGK